MKLSEWLANNPTLDPDAPDLEDGEIAVDVLAMIRFITVTDDGKTADALVCQASPQTTRIVQYGMVDYHRTFLHAALDDPEDS